MTTRILVAYASRMGSTAEIAEAIGAQLTHTDFEVDVRPCDRAADARRYDAVIIGSAIYLGRWDKTAINYLKAQAPDLAERPTWLFQSGPCGEGADTEQVPVHRTVRKLADQIGLDEPVTFSGRLDRRRASGWLSRWIATGTYAGDFRDWDVVRDWTADIAEQLRVTPQPTSSALVGSAA